MSCWSWDNCPWIQTKPPNPTENLGILVLMLLGPVAWVSSSSFTPPYSESRLFGGKKRSAKSWFGWSSVVPSPIESPQATSGVRGEVRFWNVADHKPAVGKAADHCHLCIPCYSHRLMVGIWLFTMILWVIWIWKGKASHFFSLLLYATMLPVFYCFFWFANSCTH